MVLHLEIDNNDIKENLDTIYDVFIKEYQLELATHKAVHHFVDTEPPYILSLVNSIRYSDAIKNMFDARFVTNVEEMDELYYFFPKFKGVAKTNGVDKHKDGILRIPSDKKLYRVLIGLTINHDIKTCFLQRNVEKCYTISQYEVIAFDYNNDLHYVLGSEDSNTERLLLKLHYIVSSTPDVEAYKKFHVWYANMTRRHMEKIQELERKTNKNLWDNFQIWLVLNAGWFNLHLYTILSCVVIIIIIIITCGSIVIYKRSQK
jgi:hypothetical protein